MKLLICLEIAAVAASTTHGQAQDHAAIPENMLLPVLVPVVAPLVLPLVVATVLGFPDDTTEGLSATPEVSAITGALPIPGASNVPAVPTGLPDVPKAPAVPADIPTNAVLPTGGAI